MTTLPEEAVNAASEVICAHDNAQWGDSGTPDMYYDLVGKMLTAALPFLPVQGTVKPIDTAPKTGEEFLARCGPEWPWFSCFWDGSAFVHYSHDDGLVSYPATEWMPMPEARILSALEPSAGRAAVLEEGDLNARLKAKGMYSIEELMGELPLDRWRVHSGMTDLKFFGEWLERKAREYLTMKATYDLGDKDENDDLYEWVLAHYGAFHDVLVNFRAAIRALSSPDHADAGKVEGDGWMPGCDRLPTLQEAAFAAKVLNACNGYDLSVWSDDFLPNSDTEDGLRAIIAHSLLPSAPSEGAE